MRQKFYCFIIFPDVNVKFRTCVQIPKYRFDKEVLNDLLDLLTILLEYLHVNAMYIYTFILNKLFII